MRHDNWQTRLSDYLRDCENKEFDFPTWNCAFFAAGTVEALLEVDILAEIRGKFTTETGASKQLKRIYNVNTVEELFAQKLEQEPQPIAFARLGDIVFASDDADIDLPMDTKLFGPVPGICYGNQSFFVGETGLIKVETLRLGSALWVS